MNGMMNRPSVGCVLAATLALVVFTQVLGHAQKPTDLSGKWVFA